MRSGARPRRPTTARRLPGRKESWRLLSRAGNADRLARAACQLASRVGRGAQRGAVLRRQCRSSPAFEARVRPPGTHEQASFPHERLMCKRQRHGHAGSFAHAHRPPPAPHAIAMDAGGRAPTVTRLWAASGGRSVAERPLLHALTSATGEGAVSRGEAGGGNVSIGRSARSGRHSEGCGRLGQMRGGALLLAILTLFVLALTTPHVVATRRAGMPASQLAPATIPGCSPAGITTSISPGLFGRLGRSPGSARRAVVRCGPCQSLSQSWRPTVCRQNPTAMAGVLMPDSTSALRSAITRSS